MSVQHMHPVSLAEWDDHWSEVDEVRELVGGELLMVPTERVPNVRGAMRLGIHLDGALGRAVDCLAGMEILLAPDPRPTIRRPDLVVLPRQNTDEYRLRPDDIWLVVEFLSPSTARIDLRDKVVEYASAGIPAYLLVDLRELGAQSLTLLTEPTANGYLKRQQATSLTVPIGTTEVAISVADLL